MKRVDSSKILSINAMGKDGKPKIVSAAGIPIQSEPIVPPAPPVPEKPELPVYEEIETVSDHALGFVKKGDQKQVQELIKQRLGFEPMRLGGIWVKVELYNRQNSTFVNPKTGEKTLIVVPELEHQRDKYTKCVGLVISKGPRAFREGVFEDPLSTRILRKFFGKFMKPSARKPTCEIGDWVVFPRHEGSLIGYRGVPCMIIPDDRIFGPVADPEFITLY